jgi:hypothetical protein
MSIFFRAFYSFSFWSIFRKFFAGIALFSFFYYVDYMLFRYVTAYPKFIIALD